MIDLPISPKQALEAHQWLQTNFSSNISNATNDSQFSPELFSAMVCQETAYKWLLWINDYDATTILARCVFDASGDYPGTSRSAFPKNAAAFHDKYGNEFTDMLIAEGNKQRQMPQAGHPHGFNTSGFLYKGYGIVQYDLQAVLTDEIFFRNKLWYNIDECLSRWLKELNEKSKKHTALHDIIKAYNGSGQSAENYADNVMEFLRIITSA